MPAFALIGLIAVQRSAFAAWTATYDSSGATLTDGNWTLRSSWTSKITKADGTTPDGSNGEYYISRVDAGSGVLDLRGVGAAGKYPQNHPNAIGVNVFKNNANITGVYLNDECIEIQSSAFSGSAVKFVFGGANLERIRMQSFQSCTSLTGVVCSATSPLTHIDWAAFGDCTALRSFVPFTFSALKSLGDKAFNNCPALACDLKIISPALKYLPGGSVDSSAFYRSGVTSVDLGESSIEEIRSYSFYQCGGLKTFVPPKSLKSIGTASFYQAGIGEVDFSSVTNRMVFANTAFSYCASLKDIWLSPYTTSFGVNAFSGCTQLTNVSFSVDDAGLADYRAAMSDQDGFLGKNAFWGCENLVNLELPWGGSTDWKKGATDGLRNLKVVRLCGSVPQFEDSANSFAVARDDGGTAKHANPSDYQAVIFVAKAGRRGWRDSGLLSPATAAEKARLDWPGPKTMGTFSSPNKIWVVSGKCPLDVDSGLVLLFR